MNVNEETRLVLSCLFQGKALGNDGNTITVFFFLLPLTYFVYWICIGEGGTLKENDLQTL